MSSAEKYTAETITWVKTWTPSLFSFRITRAPGYRFVPGQFARLGVRKPGLKGSDLQTRDGSDDKIVWRAYSMASADYDEFLEFYSIVVPGGEFTSELAGLKVGDTVYVDKTSYGFLTTDRFQNGKDLWMLSTGTGLAPFLAMLWDIRNWETYDHLIIVHSVRVSAELAYRELIEGFNSHETFRDFGPKLKYVPTVTREPDVAASIGALNGRITSLIADGRLEAVTGIALDLERSRIMICGNPEMVSDTRKLLGGRGFTTSRRAAPGQMAVENYW